MKGFLDVLGGAFDINKKAGGEGCRNSQAVGFGKIGYLLIVLLGRSKQGGELLGSEVLAIVRTLRIVDLLEQRRERIGVTQGQADSQMHCGRGRKAAEGLQGRDGCGHMTAERLARGRQPSRMDLLQTRRAWTAHGERRKPEKSNQTERVGESRGCPLRGTTIHEFKLGSPSRHIQFAANGGWTFRTVTVLHSPPNGGKPNSQGRRI